MQSCTYGVTFLGASGANIEGNIVNANFVSGCDRAVNYTATGVTSYTCTYNVLNLWAIDNSGSLLNPNYGVYVEPGITILNGYDSVNAGGYFNGPAGFTNLTTGLSNFSLSTINNRPISYSDGTESTVYVYGVSGGNGNIPPAYVANTATIGWNGSNGGGEASLSTGFNGSLTASFWKWSGIGTTMTETATIDSGGNYHVTSDRKLKKNIRKISYGLDTVMRLKPKHYARKDGGKGEIGFIAQDVESVAPELVADMCGNLGLNYDGFVPILVRAVQEQQAQIEALKKQLGER
jgi:hypothetical protein